MPEFLQQILGADPQAALLIVLNLIIIESLLSVDNAAVLATMVMDLPPAHRGRALKYGIIGAYVFRGLCLLFATVLVQLWWLKPLGGLYLLWLAVGFFKDRLRYGDTGDQLFKLISIGVYLWVVQADVPVVLPGMNLTFNAFWLVQFVLGLYAVYLVYNLASRAATETGEVDEAIEKLNNPVYRFFHDKVGIFWSTVILVEIMDLAFSIDNVFAAVAFTDNIWLIYIGVFIGILAMRFVAQAFVRLLERYPFLEVIAFLVIGVLGLKLSAALFTHYNPDSALARFIDSEQADTLISLFTAGMFLIPVLTSRLFNFPRRSA
jgi:YkoY family integral membrane protein